LLALTVMNETTGGVQLLKAQEGEDRYVLTGWNGDPIPLNDRRYLRLAISLYLGDSPEKNLSNVLKVRKASFQYQADEPGDEWIFRYDYLREQQEGPHPQAHLQIRGTLTEDGVLAPHRPLERVHFPTGRFSLEAAVRLLAEQFGVTCNAESEVWRAALAESERQFLEIAHQPLSGPEE
jgi:hypothetical protein